MSIWLQKIQKSTRAIGLFTIMFVMAWFFCASHITVVSADTHNDAAQPTANHHQTDGDGQNHNQTCLDHTPIQNLGTHQNDLLNIPAILSAWPASYLKDLGTNSGNLERISLFDDDHLQKRYTFLKNNTIRI